MRKEGFLVVMALGISLVCSVGLADKPEWPPRGLLNAVDNVPRDTVPPVAGLVLDLLSSNPPIRGTDLADQIKDQLEAAVLITEGEQEGQDKEWPPKGLLNSLDHVPREGPSVAGLVHDLLILDPPVRGQDLADAIREFHDSREGHENHGNHDVGDADDNGSDPEDLQLGRSLCQALQGSDPGAADMGVVPEPATVSLLVLGAGLSLSRRRKR